MKMTKRIVPLTIALLMATGCASTPSVTGDVRLGDTEEIMVAKMKGLGGRDATRETQSEFYHQISWDQRYYWWELPDKTVVAILVAAPRSKDKTVVVIETGDPGRGIKGTKDWRSQNLKCQTSLTSKGQNQPSEGTR